MIKLRTGVSLPPWKGRKSIENTADMTSVIFSKMYRDQRMLFTLNSISFNAPSRRMISFIFSFGAWSDILY
jgi:hypothetical protein